MERQEMIQKLNEATVLIGELNIPAKHTETISIPVYAALQRICAVGTELKKQEEEAHADDHDQQGD